MKKKKNKKGLRPVVLGTDKELDKYVENPPEFIKKKVARANETLKRVGLPEEFKK